MTQQETREYEWQTGQVLLDAGATGDDLLRHNNNMQAVAARSRDEAIDTMVRGLADKIRRNQNTSGNHRFAMRLHGRFYPPRIRNVAAQFLISKYEE